MACRCNEIARCERDIALITGDIARNLNNARNNNDRNMSAAANLSRSLSDAVLTNSIERVSQRIQAIKKQHEGYLDNLQSKRANELSRIKSRLENYDREDRLYHEKAAR